MKEWLTAKEIAEARLPQVPTTKQGVNALADREGWNVDPFSARKRAGRGGGMEYHVRLLPTVARVAYHAQHIVVGSPAMPAAANDAPVRVSPTLTNRAALERDARLAIVAQFERFKKGSNLRLEQAVQIFCDRWRMGRVEVEGWILDVVPRVSKGSLKRWISKKRYGQQLGVDRGLARKGTGVLDCAEGGEVRAFILGLIAHQPHLFADQVRDQVRAQFGDLLKVLSKGVEKQVPVPPLRAFQRALSALKASEKVVLTRLTNPDLYRSTMKLSGVGTMRHVTEPNAHWQIDASPVDALCTDGRHSVYVCVDIATRRVVLSLSKTPRSSAVGLLVRKAILAWGVPAEIKTDNGSDFTARATKRLLAHDLGIDLLTSDPFSPEQKGFVERAIGTFQRNAVGLVPGFIGHNVEDRTAIESRKAFAQRLGEEDAKTFAADCTAAELQECFDAWAELKYAHRPHEGLKGRTPFQAEASARYTIRRVDERALDLLLAPIAGGDGTRVMTKRGFRVDNFHYLSGSIMVGTQALVRHDPFDAGRIHLFGIDDEGYLGEAICAELAGIDPAAFMQAQREEQARLIREKTKEIEKVRRGLRSGPAAIVRAREVWLRDQPNVVALPRPETQHVTPSIAAALEASASRDETPPPARPTPVIDYEAPATVTKLDTPRTRFRRALDLESRVAAGAEIETADALWLGGYQQSPEYQGQKMVHEDLGAMRQ
jgi:putative transposase